MPLGKRLIVPGLVMLVGVTWLLNVMDILPGVDWIWTAGLAAMGVLTLAVGGINKLTAVVGPFLLAGSVCSLLRQTGRLDIDLEVPILTIVLGMLMFVVQWVNLPMPELLRVQKPD